MKALILAADSYSTKNGNQKPSCYALTVGSVSLVEYQLRLLNMLGYKYQDITIVTGIGGVWKDESLTELIAENKINELKIDNHNKRSFISFKAYLNEIKEIENLLILNGDSYFELKDLEKLIYPKFSSKVLVESRNNLFSNGLELISNSSIINEVSSEKIHNSVPWDSYYGSMYLSENDLKTLRDFIQIMSGELNLPYLDVIINHAKILATKIDINKNNSGLQGTNDKTLELVGGSFAGLHKMTLVKKYSDKEGNDKLIAEIEWLNNLSANEKNKFISVVDYQIGEDESWFTMPWYDLENLRKKIISGKFSTEDTTYYLEKILDYMFDNFYNKTVSVATENWVYEKHFDRFYSRRDEIRNIAPFNEILDLESIFINGTEYKNLHILIDRLKEIEEQTDFFRPNSLVMVHGDLHFQNMLIDSDHDDFILADPRGEQDGSDIYYDFGKLWHSINGLYDLIHTDISQATIIKKSKREAHFSLYLGGIELLETYAKLKSSVEDLVEKYPIVDDEHWLLKTKFAEVMHFSSLMYFHLKHDQKENRALCLYLQAVVLATELLNELEGHVNVD